MFNMFRWGHAAGPVTGKNLIFRLLLGLGVAVLFGLMTYTPEKEKVIQFEKLWKDLHETNDFWQRKRIILLIEELQENKGRKVVVSPQELGQILVLCSDRVKAFPWKEYANKSSEEIRDLPEDDPFRLAIAELFLLAYTNELNIQKGTQFAGFMQKGKKVSPYLKDYWLIFEHLAKDEAASIAKKRK